MNLTVFDNPEALARAAACKITDLVTLKPNASLCLAAGETPRLTYQYLVERAKKKKIGFSAVQFIGLDEWVGIPASNTGSCHYFLQETLFAPLNINDENIHFFNGTSDELSAACEQINQTVQRLQGIDLMLAGLGMNGHIGFNEPGVSPDLFAHVAELDTMTQTVGQKYFSEKTILQKGITLGMRQFMQSKTVLLLAVGQKKAAIVKKAIEGNVSAMVPASFIQKHANAFVLLDREAAGLLNNA